MRSVLKHSGKRLLLGLVGVGMLSVGAAVSEAQVCLNLPPLGITCPPLSLLSSNTFPVSITNDSPWFNPIRFSIVMGDTVKWTNLSKGTHTITSLPQALPHTEFDVVFRDAGISLLGAFDRRACLPGCTFEVTFDNPGSFPYVCFIHPYMAGNITVTLPGVTVAAGPVPDIIQGPNTVFAGSPASNGFGLGRGEVCMTADMEKPAGNVSGVVHCVDAVRFRDLPLSAFDGTAWPVGANAGQVDAECVGKSGEAACSRILDAADVPTHPLLVGRRIGGRFEGMDNAHNIWYDKTGRYMFVTEWHGDTFYTIDRGAGDGNPVTDQMNLGGSIVSVGADVTHVMTTMPGENVGMLTLEGGISGGLGFFNANFPAANPGLPATTCGIHLFTPLLHPHGPWITGSMGQFGVGRLTWPSPMSNHIGFTDLPSSCAEVVAMGPDATVLSIGLYPVATGAQQAPAAAGQPIKAYTSNAVSGTISVNDVTTHQQTAIILLPLCVQCTLMGIPTPATSVPIQIPFTPDNTRAVVAMGKASQVAIIDAVSDTVINVAECGAGCHGANMGAKAGGGFYAWASMQYQDKISVIDMSTAQKAGDVHLNARSVLTLQGLTPLGQPGTIAVAEGVVGGMGVGPFPLQDPWHVGLKTGGDPF